MAVEAFQGEAACLGIVELGYSCASSEVAFVAHKNYRFDCLQTAEVNGNFGSGCF